MDNTDNLDNSVKHLLDSLKLESDSKLQMALSILLTVKEERELCYCGKRHEYLCQVCEESVLCTDCDEGTIDDEKSVCPGCKSMQHYEYD